MGQRLTALDVNCRDFLYFRLLFTEEAEARAVFEELNRRVHVDSVQNLLAFKAVTTGSWGVFDAEQEFARQCTAANVIPELSKWRMTTNECFRLCETYPATFAVPSNVSDIVLKYAARHRSKNRLPALTYLHVNRAALVRCSQPLAGITQQRSIQDERVVEAIFEVPVGEPPGMPRNMIFDARPSTNAYANVARGAGSENLDYYRNCRKEYLGIENIHVMRDSLTALVEQLAGLQRPPSVFPESSAMAQPASRIEIAALERSNWLWHVQTLLDATSVIVETLAGDFPGHALLHCSDGWDRTAQLASLAQICLDPFFRSMRGFVVLVEKDWLAFGHKFSERCGHISTDYTAQTGAGAFRQVQNRYRRSVAEREVSPVFHQFLDCVYQLMCTFPTAFEYNERFLLQVFRSSYSCEYGNFIMDSERERVQCGVYGKTRSLWPELLSNAALYTNTAYEVSGKLDARIPEFRYWAQIFRIPGDMQIPCVARKGNRLISPPPSVRAQSPQGTDAVGNFGIVDTISNLWSRFSFAGPEESDEVRNT